MPQKWKLDSLILKGTVVLDICLYKKMYLTKQSLSLSCLVGDFIIRTYLFVHTCTGYLYHGIALVLVGNIGE